MTQMESDSEENSVGRQLRITPVMRGGELFAELRFLSLPPCPVKILDIGELETLIGDAQRVIAQMRWRIAAYYVAMESTSIDHDTRHLVLRDVVDNSVEGMRAICGRELHNPAERWSFSPLVYDIKTVYALCRTCERIYKMREKREQHI